MPKENNTRCEHSVRLPQDTQQGFTGGIYGEAENPSAKPSLIQSELESYSSLLADIRALIKQAGCDAFHDAFYWSRLPSGR